MDKLYTNVDDFDWKIIDNLKEASSGRGHSKKGKHYADAISVSDTEFDQIPYSAIEELYGIKIDLNDEKLMKKIRCEYDIDLSALYEWQVHIMAFNVSIPPYADTTHNLNIVCRTIDELVDFFSRLHTHLHGLTLIMWDHNLGCELSFFKSLLDFSDNYGELNIFAKSARDPLYAYAMEGSIEFRDSYALFNSSLKEATKGLPHAKRDDYDYNKRRYWFTPLSEEELLYGRWDTWGLCEAIYQAMIDHGDNIYTIPLTSQGYIRRDISRIMFKWNKYTDHINDTWDFYRRVLLKSNRGGNTHANRWMVGLTHLAPITVLDIASSYPSTFMEKFPLLAFEQWFNGRDRYTIDDLKKLEKDGYAYVFVITLHDVELKDIFTPVPYLSNDKSYGLIGNDGVYSDDAVGSEENENGRITKCEAVTLFINDDDWNIISKQYRWSDDYEISEVYISKYEYLPIDLINYVIDLFKKKCEFKDRDGEDERGRSYASLYRAIKPKINGVFGEMDRRVLTDDVSWNEEEHRLEESKRDMESVESSFDYQKENSKRCVKYRWGCYVCSKARRKLQEMIDRLSPPGQVSPVLYCDTDSVYVIGDVRDVMDEINQKYIKLAEEWGAYADDVKGHTHWLGAWELDKEVGDWNQKPEERKDKQIMSFRTLGAKKYAYTMYKKNKETGELELKTIITTAGVPKDKGSRELEINGGLDAFTEGFTFHAGKCAPVYNDKPYYGTVRVTDDEGNSGLVEITSNMCLVPTTYKLSYEKNYKSMLETIDEFLDRDENVFNQYGYYVAKGWIT